MFQRASALALIPTVLTALLIFTHHWIPYHDSFFHLIWAHTLASSLAHDSEIPLWAPLVSWGSGTSFFQTMSHPGLLTVLPLVKLWPTLNVARLFYLSVLLEEAVLVAGLLALARTFYRHAVSGVFVCFIVIGTAVWATSLAPNFGVYFGLPMALYLARSGIARKSLSWILLSFIVGAVTSALGNGFYNALTPCSVLLIYTISAFFFLIPKGSRGFGRPTWRSAVFCLAGAVLVLGMALPFLIEKPQVVVNGRGTGGEAGYSTFLHYGSDAGIKTFGGFFTGMGIWQDSITYGGGALFSFLLIAALWGISAEALPLLTAVCFIFLFWAADHSFVAPLLYLIPGVSLYRHIGLTAPIVKVLLVLIAGFGFDSWVTALERGNPRQLRRMGKAGAAGMAFVLALSTAYILSRNKHLNDARLALVILACNVSMTLLFGLLWLHPRRLARSRARLTLLAALALVLIDTCSFRFALFNRFMMPVDDDLWSLFQSRPLQYVAERQLKEGSEPRLAKLVDRVFAYSSPGKIIDAMNREAGWAQWDNLAYNADGTLRGAFVFYSLMEEFLNIDPCFTSLRTITSTMPSQELRDWLLKGREGGRAEGREAELIACGRPKLQLLSRLPGNELNGAPAIGQDARAEILSFGTNHLRIRLFPESIGHEAAWLYYADSWHPLWSATVNGNPAQVIRAGHAFKAVSLPPAAMGQPIEVEFRFASRLVELAFMIFWSYSTAVILGILYFSLLKSSKLSRYERESPQVTL